MQQEISSYLIGHKKAIDSLEESLSDDIVRVIDALAEALGSGGKVLLMGNGGSAADAQHFAAELVGRFLLERKALPAIALSTDTSILTAVGNDYGFDDVFRRQVEALASPGDVVIWISTSGNSPNVFRAVEAAREIGCKTMALLGKDGGVIAPIVDIPVIVPVSHTPHIQECHLTIIHLICDLLERKLFGEAEKA